MSTVRATLVLAILAATWGCYGYLPVDRASVPARAQVRARLTETGIEEMRRYLGPGVLSVEGPLVAWDGEGVALLTETFVRREGFPATFMADTIQLLPQHVADVELRTLDGKRTAGLTAIIFGATTAAIIAARAFGGGSEDPGEGPGTIPDALSVLGIRLSVGFR